MERTCDPVDARHRASSWTWRVDPDELCEAVRAARRDSGVQRSRRGRGAGASSRAAGDVVRERRARGSTGLRFCPRHDVLQSHERHLREAVGCTEGRSLFCSVLGMMIN